MSDDAHREGHGGTSAECADDESQTVAAESHLSARERGRKLRLIVVAGARGGVGKSIIAANLALYLATIGRRVVAVDASPSGGNLHTCIGAKAPRFVPTSEGAEGGEAGNGCTAEDALCATPFQGLQLLHWGATACSGSESFAMRLARLRALPADYAVLELGASLDSQHVDAFLDADLALFVLAPEPTSVENTYRFMRAAFCRQLMRRAWSSEAYSCLAATPGILSGTAAPQDLLKSLQTRKMDLVEAVQTVTRAFRPRFVVNQTRLRSDLLLGQSIQSVARRRLAVSADYLGHIDYDDVMWSCVRNRKPVLLEVPGAKCSKKMERLARRLLTIDAGKEQVRVEWEAPERSHHELLEISRGATDEEVRRAFKRARETYALDALCCYGALESEEIEDLRLQLDEALDVLLDPARRRPYELSVFPDEAEAPHPDAEEVTSDEPAEPMPELSPDTQFTGALLRKVREAKRISLRDISDRTKVGLGYLKAIELEDFGALPAPVYTSGFVTEIARYLRLDPRQVSRSYVRRYRRYLEERQATMGQPHS